MMGRHCVGARRRLALTVSQLTDAEIRIVEGG